MMLALLLGLCLSGIHCFMRHRSDETCSITMLVSDFRGKLLRHNKTAKVSSAAGDETN